VSAGEVEHRQRTTTLSLLAALPLQGKVAACGLEALFEQRRERKLADAVRRWQVEHRLGRNGRP
jgi:hypothetical protein